MAKVIHVHLTRPIDGTKRRDWYFASIAAVYTVLTADQVGATKGYLQHAGLSGNGTTALEGKYNGISRVYSTSGRLYPIFMPEIGEKVRWIFRWIFKLGIQTGYSF